MQAVLGAKIYKIIFPLLSVDELSYFTLEYLEIICGKKEQTEAWYKLVQLTQHCKKLEKLCKVINKFSHQFRWKVGSTLDEIDDISFCI